MTVRLRPYAKGDEARLIEILGAVFGEYGMRFDPDGYDRDVRQVETRYAAPDGVFFTAEEDGRVLAFAGGDIPRPGVAEVHRLYLDPAARGRGLGRVLCEAIEEWGRGRGAHDIELWSDVRFGHAHALYAGRGYRLMGQRTLADPDRSVEYGFRRPLSREVVPAVHDARAARVATAATPDLEHRARMVAAAILDSRALVRAGRVARGGHVLPPPAELFGGRDEARVLVLETPLTSDVVVGFEGPGGARRLHSLFLGGGVPR